jgi:methionyl-tRNA formyltransferase
MNFGRIDRIVLFGGDRLLADLAQELLKKDKYSLIVYSSDRHLKEPVYPGGETLEEALRKKPIEVRSSQDINSDPDIRGLITPSTLGLGFGEAWSFSKEILDLFGGRLLDFMGIRLPRDRGGAHHTWKILRGDRLGCCHLQIINEFMVQGEFDSGEIVKSREFLFPAEARLPADYAEALTAQGIALVMDFLSEIEAGKDFPLSLPQESFSLFFPRLYTQTHGFIDWSWDTRDIERFICAFDDPYAGASTFLKGTRVYLKKCQADYNEGSFHPFQSGLIFKKGEHSLFVASRSGTLVIESVQDESGSDLIPSLKVGQRFFTPRENLEAAMRFEARYSAEGLA